MEDKSWRRESLRHGLLSLQFFDEEGSVYVCLCPSGESLERNCRGGRVIYKSEYVAG